MTYKFGVVNLDEMKKLVPALVALCKRGHVWGQRYRSIRVWRSLDGFSGVMEYDTPTCGDANGR